MRSKAFVAICLIGLRPHHNNYQPYKRLLCFSTLHARGWWALLFSHTLAHRCFLSSLVEWAWLLKVVLGKSSLTKTSVKCFKHPSGMSCVPGLKIRLYSKMLARCRSAELAPNISFWATYSCSVRKLFVTVSSTHTNAWVLATNGQRLFFWHQTLETAREEFKCKQQVFFFSVRVDSWKEHFGSHGTHCRRVCEIFLWSINRS